MNESSRFTDVFGEIRRESNNIVIGRFLDLVDAFDMADSMAKFAEMIRDDAAQIAATMK